VSGEFVRTPPPAEVDALPVSTPRRFTATDWALPGRALDVNLEGSYVHQYKLEISGYLILSGTLVISIDLKTPRFCGT
jgi:hypothetical protein